MRISDVQTFVLGTPWRNLTIVKVATDEGLTGVGEVRMLGHTQALLGYLSEGVPRHVLGLDPFNTEHLVRTLWRDDFARVGEIAMSAIAVLEIACMDIKAKALGIPVYQLLGGAVRQRIKAYANGWYTVERTPEEFARAARKVVQRGYRAMKFDPFGPGYYELELSERLRAISLVEAVRAEVGPEIELLIEMHGRFTPFEAVRVARELEPYNPSWIEEPVPPENLKALHKVAEQVHVPIATGERIHTRHDFRELLELQAADILQVDITHFGGLGEAHKLAGWADACYVMMAPHNVGATISTAANLHFAAATPNFKIQEHFNDFADEWVKQAAPGLPEVDPADGCFPLPGGPGLGVTLNEDFVLAHPMEQVDFNLFRSGWEKRSQAATPAGASGYSRGR